MERRTNDRACDQPPREERPRPPVRPDDREPPRVESLDLAEERTLEEAGYGYGV